MGQALEWAMRKREMGIYLCDQMDPNKSGDADKIWGRTTVMSDDEMTRRVHGELNGRSHSY